MSDSRSKAVVLRVFWLFAMCIACTPTLISQKVSDAESEPPFRLDSIVDVVKPEPRLLVPPFTTVAWAPLQNPITNADLNGIWENLEGADHVERVRVFQLRDTILVDNLEGRRDFLPNTPIFEGGFTSPSASIGRVWIDDHGDMKFKRTPATLTMRDSSHFDISDGSKYRLVSRTTVRDIPCDYRNLAHTSGQDAYNRGYIYSDDPKAENHEETSKCWYYVGAKAGMGSAQAKYASLLLRGSDPQEVKQGVLWMQLAGMQADHLEADNYLAQMFEQGIGVPESAQRAAYWRARGLGAGLLNVHEAQTNRFQPWMSHTAEQCDESNPPLINGDDALRKGRVAYQARSLQNAHCWFRISAAKGNIKAVTYLGIQSTFGLGVKKNLRNGYIYMRHAALQKDMFARVYLANFLIYGIGTEKDQHEADIILTSVTRTAEGNDAYDRVQGLLVSAGEALNAFAGLVASEEDEATCRQKALLTHHQNVNCSNDGDSDAVTSLAKGVQGRSTLANVEEIYPEVPFWHE